MCTNASQFPNSNEQINVLVNKQQQRSKAIKIFMEPLSLLILIALFIFVFIFSFTTYFSPKATTSSALPIPPGSSGWPIFGELFAFSSGSAAFVHRKASLHHPSPVFRTALLSNPIAVVLRPSATKLLFSSENSLVHTWWPSSILSLFSSSLISSSGRPALLTRRLLTSFLSPDALRRFIPLYDSSSRLHLLSHWSPNHHPLLAFPLVKLFTFSLACAVFTGLDDPTVVSALLSHFKVFVKGLLGVPLNLPGTRFYRSSKAAKKLREELRRLMERKRDSLPSSSAAERVDLMTYLMVTEDEEGKLMSEREIVDNILLLLFAGHDTTTAAITMLLKYLGELPHIYDGVFREQMEIAKLKAPEELLDWRDIQKMKYSWNVVNEVMRLSPPVQGAFKEAIVDFTCEGYTIPKGWKIYWTVHSTNKNPTYFPEPEKFDPSRFEGDGPAPYTFIPFGGGPRMCPGKELARLQILVFLHNLVRRFRWETMSPNEKIVIDPMPTPLEGLPLRLHPHHLQD